MTPVDSETRASQCPPRHACPECCEVCRARRELAAKQVAKWHNESKKAAREAEERFWVAVLRVLGTLGLIALALWALGRFAVWVGGAL